MTDVLIVGAGPVGLTMAAECARYGLSVRIIDRASHATETSKALVVWSRTLELMDRMGCTEAFLAAGIRGHAASFRSGGRVLGHARFDDVDSPYNFALMLPQRDTERLLAEHLRGFDVTVEREVELATFRDTGEQVEAHLRSPGREIETAGVAWLIGCDGAHSAVRHGLHMAFRGQPQGDDWVLGDVRLSGPGAPPGDETVLYLHRDGILGIFPMPGDRARIIATLGRSDPARARPTPTLDDFQALIDHRTGGGFRAEDPVWLSNFHVNERKVASYSRGRVFLAGDAAHIHSPAGGQGMNTGMQDAINLAWKLAMVTRGIAAPALLDSYSPERSEVGDMVLRNASRLTDMATLAHPAAQVARNLALRFALGLHAVQDRLVTTMAETDIAYGGSALSVGIGRDAHGLAAGARLDPALYGGTPPGSGETPRFVLFHPDPKAATEWMAPYVALVEAAPRNSPLADRMLIVRPDGYIGLSATASDRQAAESYLARLAPP